MINNKEKLVFKISYVIILLVVCSIALGWYSKILRNELKDLVRNTLKQVSNQNVLIVQKEIEGDLNALTEVAERIGALGALGELQQEEIVETLKEVSYRYPFKRMGFCGTDGIAYATDGNITDISERSYFEASLQGKKCISEPFADPLSGGDIIVFSVPVRSNSEIVGIVFATYGVDSMKEILSVSSFEGKGYTYIVRRDGSKVVDSVSPTSFQNMSNIFTSMKAADRRNTQAVRDLKRILDKDETGYVIFYNEIGKYMYATPLGINDWFLIDVVPVDFMESTSNYIIHRTYLICALLAAVSVVLAAMLYQGERKKKQQMQNLLFVDELTGGDTLAKFKSDAEQNSSVSYDGFGGL